MGASISTLALAPVNVTGEHGGERVWVGEGALNICSKWR